MTDYTRSLSGIAPSKQESTTYEPSLVCKLLILGCRLLIPDRLLVPSKSLCDVTRTSTLLTSNRPVEDWGKLLGDSAAVTAMLDRLLHHGHILNCGTRSRRTKTGLPSPARKG